MPTTQPPEASESGSGFAPTLKAFGQGTLDRLYAFRVIYIAIFLFMLLYVFSVRGAEQLLQNHFEQVVRDSIRITNLSVPVQRQIHGRIDKRVENSRWVRWGGVHATVIVLADDGLTWLYVGGRAIMPPPSLDAGEIAREALRLLPAQEEVIISVPHNALLANAILVFYAAVLLSGLFFYTLAVGRRESNRLQQAVADRDLTALRAESIQQELEAIRRRMLEAEPAEREQTEEVLALEEERASLQQKLAALAEREGELRSRAARAVNLDQDRKALEDLLEEAAGHLSAKDEEIRNLEKTLKRSGHSAQTGPTRGKDALARRFDTLYKNLEIDGRALADLIALRDETMKLKAEESLKRLSDETGNTAVRRKVGGLPPSHTIFELGFAGKGRVYYTKGSARRFRILAIGAKNTQKTDLDYLRKLSF